MWDRTNTKKKGGNNLRPAITQVVAAGSADDNDARWMGMVVVGWGDGMDARYGMEWMG